MNEYPEVCCVCLYADRPQFVPLMLQSFRRQTYANKQLLIYDNCNIFAYRWERDLNLDHELVVHGPRGLIGQMRNAANSFVKSDIICHFDVDDYSAPSRIEEQVNRMLVTGKSVTGYNATRFLRVEDGQWFQYTGAPQYAFGTSLCYTKAWWEKHPFRPMHVAEDRHFVDAAWNAREFISTDAGEIMYATIHAGNTASKHVNSSNWRKLPDCRALYPEAFAMAAAGPNEY